MPLPAPLNQPFQRNCLNSPVLSDMLSYEAASVKFRSRSSTAWRMCSPTLKPFIGCWGHIMGLVRQKRNTFSEMIQMTFISIDACICWVCRASAWNSSSINAQSMWLLPTQPGKVQESAATGPAFEQIQKPRTAQVDANKKASQSCLPQQGDIKIQQQQLWQLWKWHLSKQKLWGSGHIWKNRAQM